MAPKECKGFLSLSCFGKKKAIKEELHSEIFNNYRHLGTSGYRTEVHIGDFLCGHCKNNKIHIHRCTLFEGGVITEQLRFEQTIRKKTANLALAAPLTWNDEARRVQKELPKEKWDGKRLTASNGLKWIIVKQEVLAVVKCVKCQGMAEISNKIVEEDGKEKLKWYLCQRDVNSTGTGDNGAPEKEM